MKKIMMIVLALVVALGCLVSGASAEALAASAGAAVFLGGTFWQENGKLNTFCSYTDPEGITWVEVYLLEEGEIKPNMGTVMIGGKTYSVRGIQSIDNRNPNMYKHENGVTELNCDLYLGNCPMPEVGSEVFLAIGLTDSKTKEETILGPVPVTVPAEGEKAQLAGENNAAADDGADAASGDVRQQGMLDGVADYYLKLMNGKCYIATCVYGSYDCSEVWVLRRFRDNVLAKSVPGQLFIQTYYALSPSLVENYGDQTWFSAIFRPTLDWLVNTLKASGLDDAPYTDPY